MNITDEAAEVALEVFWAKEDEPYIEAMRAALQSAAPHIAAAAWDEGADFVNEGVQSFASDNPYRTKE